MKEVVLERLELEGFRSFKEHTVIEFSHTHGLKLISGANQLEPELGANGAGKSTLFDALCYVNYGTSVKGLKASDLMSYGAKNLAVKATYKIEDQTQIVRRTGSPERIYIDEAAATQNDVDRLLGLSKARFLSSVIFGQAVPLFLDLSVPARGELLDEILPDMACWLIASDRASKHHIETLSAINALEQNKARKEGELDGLSSLDEIASNEKDWEDSRTEKLEALLDAVERHEAALKDAEAEIAELGTELGANNVDDINERMKQSRAKLDGIKTELALKRREIERILEDAAFYVDNTECPVCGAEFDEKTSDQHLTEAAQQEENLKKEITALEKRQTDVSTTLTKQETQWREAMNRVSACNETSARLGVQASAERREIARLEREAEALANEDNPWTKQRESLETKRSQILVALSTTEKQLADANSKLAQYAFWKAAFKRVRLFCVKRVLRQLEAETMNAAAALGLIGWRIHYTTETETKSGTLKSGVQVEVESPYLKGKLECRSPGESQRVRLCVSLGLASLVQRYAGVRWNLEVYDEPTNWLSERGIENFLQCLDYRADRLNKAIYVVDHRALVYSGFSEIYQVTKDENGSSIRLLNRTETA